MNVGFLFGWAEEQGVDVPTKSDGTANINELFALYNEWKKSRPQQGVPRSATRVSTQMEWTMPLWSRDMKNTPARQAAL